MMTELDEKSFSEGALPQALLSSVIALESGDSESSRSFARKALDLQPDSVAAKFLMESSSGLTDAEDVFLALTQIAVLLRDSDRWESALHYASRAVEIRPEDPEAHCNLGLCLLAGRRLDEAALSFNRAISLQPSDAVPYQYVGEVRRLQGSNDRAAKAYRYAVERAPTPENFNALGTVLLNGYDLAGAQDCANQCLALHPHSAGAHLILCGVLVQQGKSEEAEAHLRQGIELDSQKKEAMLVARRQRAFGRFDEANENLRLEIARNPRNIRAYAELMYNQKTLESERPLVESALGLLNRPLSPDESIFIHYGLGKALEDLGDFAAAMGHYDEANRVCRLVKVGDEEFDRSQHTRNIDRLLDLFSTGEPPKEVIFTGSEIPILVVGMMRSGTTLAEQILSNHPRVAAAGEQMFWSQQWPRAVREAQGKPDPERLARLGYEYVQMLRGFGPDADRVTDKMPGNFLALGLILRAVPNARVIHLRRSPIDNCLSIWATPNDGLPDGQHDKSGLVFAYKEYLRVMEHWRSLMPADRFFEVNYEDLVADQEKVTRQMIDFCGLEWHEGCLYPETNPRLVKTPSVWQVRQPVYRTSVERWKKFQPVLGEFKDLLELSHPDAR